MASIAEQTKQAESFTEPWNALRYFTDRNSLIRQFCSALNREPSPGKILFFHGDGGNGKSLLLQHLRKTYSKRIKPDVWKEQSWTDDDIVDRIAMQGYEFVDDVPVTYLDFADDPDEDARPKEALYALLMMRRQLAGQGIGLPLFDFVLVYYLLHPTNKHRWKADRVKSLFPAAEAGLFFAFIDAASHSTYGSIASAMLGVLDKHLEARAVQFWRKRGLDKAYIDRIAAMDAESELHKKLPTFFAESMNAAMAGRSAPKRIVLFFDSHEAFWGADRDLPVEAAFSRDRWLRMLLRSLDLSTGIMVVVAGRDMPDWPSAPREDRIDRDFLQMESVRHLPRKDADSCLQAMDFTDADVRRSILDFSEVVPDEIHPLCLGLAADTARASAARGEPFAANDDTGTGALQDKMNDLINRLLRGAGE